MRTISNYTIYCTEEQTKKAFELGAPTPYYHNTLVSTVEPHFYVGKVCSQSWDAYVQPTAEQMCGWLRSQGVRFRIKDLEESTHWEVTIDGWIADGELSTSKEATLAAIDAALEYLSR